MKSIYLSLFCCLLVLTAGSLTANGQMKSCLGEWSFRCPDALDGFDTCIIRITPDSVCTEYPGPRYIFSSNRTECINDTLGFKMEINGQQIICEIKLEDGNILSGNLLTKHGSFPIILIKEDRICRN
jgi:hypothetical protein